MDIKRTKELAGVTPKDHINESAEHEQINYQEFDDIMDDILSSGHGFEKYHAKMLHDDLFSKLDKNTLEKYIRQYYSTGNFDGISTDEMLFIGKTLGKKAIITFV